MTYKKLTFSPNEELSSAKMNKLASNMDGLRDGSYIANGSIEPGKLKTSAFSQSSTNGWSIEIKPNGKKRYLKKTTITKTTNMDGGGWDIIKVSDLPAGITTQTPNVIFKASGGLRLNGNNSFSVALTEPYLAGGVNNFDVSFVNGSNANASIGTRDVFLEIEEI